jgi:hypothetical protein
MTWHDPATRKQYQKIYAMELQLGRTPRVLSGLTKHDAKLQIDALQEHLDVFVADAMGRVLDDTMRRADGV